MKLPEVELTNGLNIYTESAALDQGRIWKVLCQFLPEGVDIPLPTLCYILVSISDCRTAGQQADDIATKNLYLLLSDFMLLVQHVSL